MQAVVPSFQAWLAAVLQFVDGRLGVLSGRQDTLEQDYRETVSMQQFLSDQFIQLQHHLHETDLLIDKDNLKAAHAVFKRTVDEVGYICNQHATLLAHLERRQVEMETRLAALVRKQAALPKVSRRRATPRVWPFSWFR